MDNINLLFQQAVQCMQSNQLAESEKLLKKIIKNKVEHVDVFLMYGIVLGMQKKYRDALESFLRANKLDTNRADIYINLATTYDELKIYLEAIKAFKKAIQIDQTNSTTWLGIGKSYFSNNQIELAFESLKKSIELNSQDFRTWFNLGIVQDYQQDYDGAIDSYNKALELQPNIPEVLVNRGNAYFKKPNDSLATKLALENYNLAIQLKPDCLEAYAGKAQVLRSLNQLQEAFEACTKGLEFNPQHIDLLMNLGFVFNSYYQFNDAVTVYEKILKINPKNFFVMLKKAIALSSMGKNEESLEELRNLYRLNPDFEELIGRLVHTQMILCDWTNLTDRIHALKQEILKNSISFNPFVTLSTLDIEHQYIAAKTFSLKNTIYPPREIPIKDLQHRKIRIGYISADFRYHAVGLLTAELFESHDRDSFEVFGFSLRNPSPEDNLRPRLNKAFDEMIDLEGLTLAETFQKYLSYNLDIAIDLGGHAGESDLTKMQIRLAPIQISYIGYPGTSGASFIDYTIGDQVMVPIESQRFYSEKIIYMPHCFQVTDSKRDVPQDLFTKEELNLPIDQFIFCSFNNNYKINPMMFDVWMRILTKVPNSVLWLLASNQTTQHNLIKEAKIRGVEPKRLIFAQRIPYEKYLSRFRVADLFLDTLPFNAGATASDCLWAGLPVLTCLGDAYAGRMAGSLLSSIGLKELITNTLEEYENLAVELANNPHRIQELKDKHEKNRLTTPLFDTKTFTRDLEKAYKQIISNYHNQVPIDHIYVENIQ